MQPIAIDLLWLRPGKVGGTEYYIRNLLDGMIKTQEDFLFVLICSIDNADTFDKYLVDPRIRRIIANVYSGNISKRIIWQNIHQNALLRKNHIKYCFTPVYCRPILNGGIKYINTIHDIQAHFYPHYHPFYEVWFSEINWIVDKYKSKRIIAISQSVKNDLVSVYGFKPERIDVIYNPIKIDMDKRLSVEDIEHEYGIKKGEYYYTTSQLIPHKNLKTLLLVFKEIRDRNLPIPHKLIVSGIRGNAADSLLDILNDYNLKENVIFTGFVDDATRNSLYLYCRAFLFPSVFEGFGMPAVEAMYLGKSVLTTRCASIPEVTQNKANYVDDPYNVDEWIDKMANLPEKCEEIDYRRYDEVVVAKEYIRVIRESIKES